MALDSKAHHPRIEGHRWNLRLLRFFSWQHSVVVTAQSHIDINKRITIIYCVTAGSHQRLGESKWAKANFIFQSPGHLKNSSLSFRYKMLVSLIHQDKCFGWRRLVLYRGTRKNRFTNSEDNHVEEIFEKIETAVTEKNEDFSPPYRRSKLWKKQMLRENLASP